MRASAVIAGRWGLTVAALLVVMTVPSVVIGAVRCVLGEVFTSIG